MGQKCTKTEFEHTYTEEPHASRRKEILKKYPEMKKLFGSDPWLMVWLLMMVTFQLSSLFVVYHLSWPMTLLLSYIVGGTINHSLVLGIHEIAHCLAFGYRYPAAHKVLGIVASMPVCVPVSASFKSYHLDHHKFQGVKQIDTDIPSEIEARLVTTTFGKFLWVLMQPFFYSLRPFFTNPKPITYMEMFCVVLQLAFNASVIYYFNVRTFIYLLFGSIISMGLHPMAGHFIAEHYMFNKGQETYSYYGPLNMLSFNVGYHNEHHDFPFVPGSRLPEVRAMAPEYYDTLPSHGSWVKVIYDFIMDPSIGPYARLVRDQNGEHAKAEHLSQDTSSHLNGKTH